jgi:hypothetical protein
MSVEEPGIVFSTKELFLEIRADVREINRGMKDLTPLAITAEVDRRVLILERDSARADAVEENNKRLARLGWIVVVQVVAWILQITYMFHVMSKVA